jgi:hypothetical protein
MQLLTAHRKPGAFWTKIKRLNRASRATLSFYFQIMANPPLDSNSILGALLCGAMISNLLGGFFTIQVFIYYQNYPRDRWLLKALVSIKVMLMILR